MNALDIKQDFPLLRESTIVYLDSAATSQKPETVLRAVDTFYRVNYASVHRGIYDLAEKATGLYEDARTAVATFINAAPDEVVFTSGATEGINMVAYGWVAHFLQAGDEIIVPESEHHANLLVWKQLAHERNFTLTFIPLKDNFALDIERFLDAITTRTRFVACSMSSHIFGNYPESYLEAIIQKAHRVGAAVLIDAAQAAGHRVLDVRRWDIDFLVFSGHKMFAPTGIGILYSNRSFFAQWGIYKIGGGMVHSAKLSCVQWKEMPYRLEAGTPPIAQAIGLHAAVKYFNEKINLDELAEHEDLLAQTFITQLQKYDDIAIMLPAYEEKVHNHVVSFYSKKYHAHDIACALNQKNIAVRAGHHCAQPIHQRLGIDASVRVSFHAYTTMNDVEACVMALQQLY